MLIAAGAVLLVVAFGAVARSDAFARQDCPKLGDGQAAIALPNGSASNSWRAEFEARFNEKGVAAADFAVPIEIQSPGGSVNDWQFLISEGQAYLNWEDSSGSYTDMLNSGAMVVDGQWHSFRAEVTQSGTDILATLTVDGTAYGPSTLAGRVLDSANSKVAVNPLKDNQADGVRNFVWRSSAACAKV